MQNGFDKMQNVQTNKSTVFSAHCSEKIQFLQWIFCLTDSWLKSE